MHSHRYIKKFVALNDPKLTSALYKNDQCALSFFFKFQVRIA